MCKIIKCLYVKYNDNIFEYVCIYVCMNDIVRT
jgi:hypothetical protein